MDEKKLALPPILIPVDPVHGAHARQDGIRQFVPLKDAQAQFLCHPRIMTEKGDREAALSKSWRAATQRNKTFADQLRERERRQVRKSARDWIEALVDVGEYEATVSERRHEQNIERLAKDLSTAFPNYLHCKRFSLATSQKFLNLYLKYLWCFGEASEPPQCPLDRVVQKNAGFPDKDIVSWTKITKIKEYRWVVARLTAVAHAHGLSLSEWELRFGWREAQFLASSLET